jgi:hypothetical protein
MIPKKKNMKTVTLLKLFRFTLNYSFITESLPEITWCQRRNDMLTMTDMKMVWEEAVMT